MGQLSEQLAAIGLRYTAAQLDDTIALATRKRWTTIQLLEYLVETEGSDRARRSLSSGSTHQIAQGGDPR